MGLHEAPDPPWPFQFYLVQEWPQTGPRFHGPWEDLEKKTKTGYILTSRINTGRPRRGCSDSSRIAR